MKKLFSRVTPSITICFAFVAAISVATFIFAAEKKEARVTEVIRDVRLLSPRQGPRPAVVNEKVHEGTAVRTGRDSRAELTFPDQTLARLGENTVFSLGAGVRTYDLGNGAILMSAPQRTGTVRIASPVATAAVTGFTVMFEEHRNGWSKFIVLHGKGTVSFKGIQGGPCGLHTGQMIIWPPHPVRCPEVLNIDLSKLLQGKLVKGFKRPLPELALILADIKDQQTSPPPNGLVDPTNQNTLDLNRNAHPPPPTPRPPHMGGSPPGE
jgi:hypothetical protein